MDQQLATILATLVQQQENTNNIIVAMQQQQQAQHQMQVQQTQALQEVTRNRREGGVVDVSKIGKPEHLKGPGKAALRSHWTDWSYTFRTWFSSQFQHGEDILKWASDQYDRQIDMQMITEATQTHPQWAKEMLVLSKQLHVSLVALCRDESLSMVKNACKGDSMGLDAWRRLSKEYDPVNAMSNRRLLRKLTHPEQASLENLRKHIEEWEHSLREYEDRTGKNLEDDQTALFITNMCPESLRDHLEIQASRLNTYDLIRKEVDAYLESRSAREAGGATAMDIGSFTKGHKGKSKGGGKGKDKGKSKSKTKPPSGTNQPTDACKHCAKALSANHTEFGCWYNPRNPSPEAVAKRKAKGKSKGGGKGRGKQKGIRSLEEQGEQEHTEGFDENAEVGLLIAALEEDEHESRQVTRSPPAGDHDQSEEELCWEADEEEINDNPRCCPHYGHPLKARIVNEEITCSLCEVTHPVLGDERPCFLSCIPCDFDKCMACMRKQVLAGDGFAPPLSPEPDKAEIIDDNADQDKAEEAKLNLAPEVSSCATCASGHPVQKFLAHAEDVCVECRALASDWSCEDSLNVGYKCNDCNYVLCLDCGLSPFCKYRRKKNNKSNYGYAEQVTQQALDPQVAGAKRVLNHIMLDVAANKNRELRGLAKTKFESALLSATDKHYLLEADHHAKLLADTQARLKAQNAECKNKGHYEDARYKADVAAGHPPGLARDKFKARVRCLIRRRQGFASRATLQWKMQEHYDKTFLQGAEVARETFMVPTIGKFDGDRKDLKEEYVRMPMSTRQRKAFRVSPSPKGKKAPSNLVRTKFHKRPKGWLEDLPHWMVRSAQKKAGFEAAKKDAQPEGILWCKPQWKKRNTRLAKQKHYQKQRERRKINPNRRDKKKAKNERRRLRKAGFLSPDARPEATLRPNPDRPRFRPEPRKHRNLRPAWSYCKEFSAGWASGEITTNPTVGSTFRSTPSEAESWMEPSGKRAARNCLDIVDPRGKKPKTSESATDPEPRQQAVSASAEVDAVVTEDVVHKPHPLLRATAKVLPRRPLQEKRETRSHRHWPDVREAAQASKQELKAEPAQEVKYPNAPWRVHSLEESGGDDLLSFTEKTDPAWLKLEVGVDSCAAVSCISAAYLQDWPLYQNTSGPEAYTSAARTKVEVQGIRQPMIWLQNNTKSRVNLKVLEPLHKTLFAVSALVKKNRIVFDLEKYGGSYMEDRATGHKVKIYERNKIFVMPVWFKVSPPEGHCATPHLANVQQLDCPFVGRPVEE